MNSDRLTRAVAGADPIALFTRWFEEAQGCGLELPNAVNLATVDAEGRPRARMVLLKQADANGFVFFSNYYSAKAEELKQNSYVALTFWWEPLHRQVRVEGVVERLSSEASCDYFASRPRASQIGAYASHQSMPVPDGHRLERQYREMQQRFEGQDIPCPDFWGGYLLSPHQIEFWQNAPSRMHDRLVYRRKAEKDWETVRLSP